MPDFTLTEKENHHSIEASMGDAITIRLEENPTTGFAWHWEDFPKDFLALESSELMPFAISGVGGGGIRQFRVRVRVKGSTKIHINLQRAWEKQKPAARVFTLSIAVK